MDQIEIAIGTYENLILGYRLEKTVGSEGFTLESSFTTDSHCGALRCLAVSPHGVLVSSSTDDSIRLHSLKKRREVGTLFQHDGSVNCLRFFRGGHMFSASEDGTICLWKYKNWELLRVLKGHRCHVLAVTVHPSGKLGLSIGNDRTFFTWDMTTGKLAFKRKTDEVAQDLLFTHEGNHYILVYQKKIEVCSLEDTEVIQEIKFNSRINAVCLVEENILAVGGDDGKVSIINVMSNTQLVHKTFKGRVRSLCSVATEMGLLLFVASSSGSIRVCKLDLTEGDESVDTIVDFESGTRLTCMAVYAPPETLKEEKQAIENLSSKKNVKETQNKKRKASEMDTSIKDEEEEDNSSKIEDDDDEDEESGEEHIDDADKLESSDEIKEETDERSEEEETIKPNRKRKTTDSSPIVNKKKKKKNLEKLPKKKKSETKKEKKFQSEATPPRKRKKIA